MLRTTSTAIALAAGLGLGLCGPAFANSDAAKDDHDVSATQAEDFEQYAVSNPEKLGGLEVQDYLGNRIGEVEKLAQSRDDDELYLVVNTEDFFHSGEEDTAIALDNFEWRDDDLVLMSQGTDLPLSIVDYDDTEFKTFEYTGEKAPINPDKVRD